MKRKLNYSLLFLVISLFFAACEPAPNDPTETAANPFTQGTTTASEESASPSQASVSTTAPSNDSVEGPTFPDGYAVPEMLGMEIVPFNPSEDTFIDDGTGMEFINYRGGELSISVTVKPTGYEYAGFGIMLFIDGMPQPYRTSSQEEYQYIHAFYLPDGEHDLQLQFIPVTGKAGDRKSLLLNFVAAPELVVRDPNYEQFTSHSISASWSYFLNFLADAPEQTLPPIADRLISQTVTYDETTYEESIKLSEEARRTGNHKEFQFINQGGTRSIVQCGITAEKTLETQLIVFGMPEVNYRLIIFYENLPIAVTDIPVIDFDSGEKAIVNTVLDLTGFDGYAQLYSMLIPINGDLREDGTLQVSNTCQADYVSDNILTSAETYQDFLTGNY